MTDPLADVIAKAAREAADAVRAHLAAALDAEEALWPDKGNEWHDGATSAICNLRSALGVGHARRMTSGVDWPSLITQRAESGVSGWWRCPARRCPHPFNLHDIEDADDELPRCCVDGCDCGRKDPALSEVKT